MKRKKQVPYFKTEAEEADFWSTHSSTDYELEPVDEQIQLAPELARKIAERSKKKMIAIRLEHWQLQRTKSIAAKRRMPYQHLLRDWITEGLKREALRSSGKHA